MVSYGHELGQRWVPEDGIVWQANVGDVEVNELGAVVVACPEGDREADLPNRDRGAVSDTREGLGWLKLVIGHLEIVERFHGQDVEPCPTIDEGPGDLHIADDWGAKHREDSGHGCALELIRRAECDSAADHLRGLVASSLGRTAFTSRANCLKMR